MTTEKANRTVAGRVLLTLLVGSNILAFLGDRVGASAPPLLPFDQTGDMFVLDSGSGHVLRITPNGAVSIEIDRAEILALTGGDEVGYDNKGIALDADGALYFTALTYNSVDGPFAGNVDLLKKTAQGTLRILTSQADRVAATGAMNSDAEGIAFDSNGFLNLVDDNTNALLRVNPSTGAVSVLVDSPTLEALPGLSAVTIDGGIAAGPGGLIYLQSDSDPNAVISVANGTPSVLTSGPPLSDPDKFMTRSPEGDILIADESPTDIDKGTGLFENRSLTNTNVGSGELRDAPGSGRSTYCTSTTARVSVAKPLSAPSGTRAPSVGGFGGAWSGDGRCPSVGVGHLSS